MLLLAYLAVGSSGCADPVAPGGGSGSGTRRCLFYCFDVPADPIASTSVPVEVSSESTFVDLALGERACAVTASGRVYCWGASLTGGEPDFVPTPLFVAPVRSIASSSGSLCAVQVAGGVSCWGENSLGQLGTVNTYWRFDTPSPVPGTGGIGSVDLHVDDTYAVFVCGLDTARRAYCWGSNRHGELGRDTIGGAFPVPAPVTGDHEFSVIGTGRNFSCALDDDGLAWCWGASAYGRLGGGESAADVAVPQPVAGDHRFTDLSVGTIGACGVKEGGDVWCWGGVARLDPGVGHFDSAVPVPVPQLPPMRRVFVGFGVACALDVGGEAWCWGSDSFGQTGADDDTPYATVVRVRTAARFTKLAFGNGSTCGIADTGRLWCWGADFSGSLGNGP